MTADSSKPRTGLEFFQALSAGDLLEKLNSASEAKVVSIYAVGSIHFAWVDYGSEKKIKGGPSGSSKKL